MKKITLILGILGVIFIFMIVIEGPCYSADVIYACIKKVNGQARIVSTPSECLPSEVSVQWNQVGPQGPTGPTGPTGLTGQPGVLGFYVVDQEDQYPYYSNQVTRGASAFCNDGDIAISCGYSIDSDILHILRVTGVTPQFDLGGIDKTRVCTVFFNCIGNPSCPTYPYNYEATTTVRAICADITP